MDETLIELVAEQRATQILLTALFVQVIGSATDWRERLSVMRDGAEVTTAQFTFTGGDPAMNEAVQARMRALVAERFDDVQQALLAWEQQGRPSPYKRR